MSHTAHVCLDTPNEIVTRQILDAPRELVWRAFTEPEHVAMWWGPMGFTTTTKEMDVREGGVWRHTMHGPDGRNYPNRIAYTKVVPFELLAWAHDDDSGGTPLFHATVSFQSLGERTLVTLRHIFPSGEARDHNIKTYGSVQGVIDTTNRLAGHLVTIPNELDFLISREYDAPRERLWKAWTDSRQLSRWWGPAIFRNTSCEVDLRVGGRYTITMTGPFPGPGDSDYPVDGEFLEIIEPERLVMTVDCTRHPPWWHDAVKPGRTAEERNPAGTMLQTVSLETLTPARTRLTIRTRMVSAELLASMKRLGMSEGWAESLNRLATELQSIAT